MNICISLQVDLYIYVGNITRGAPVPDRAVVRHILQPKLATCLHILEPIFEFAFAV